MSHMGTPGTRTDKGPHGSFLWLFSTLHSSANDGIATLSYNAATLAYFVLPVDL